MKGQFIRRNKVALNKDDIVKASLDSAVISVVIFSPIRTTLEMGQPVTIKHTGEYVFRVLLPRAFARRNENHRYQLILNIENNTIQSPDQF